MGSESLDQSLTEQVEFDAICMRFEQSWRQGGRLSIESCLAETSQAGRPKLLVQLLLLEFEYLEQTGTPPAIDEYLARFSSESEIVRHVLDEHRAAIAQQDGDATDCAQHANLDGTVDYHPVAEGPGSSIGRYKLLEQIGEGGMGVVYMADQQRPVRRKVALKIIKPGMDTKQFVARFEAERQALAMMDHPNIARVLDAGSTKSGRPYFVMELVRGVSITKYCDQAKLDTIARLQLFKLVCQAVQHAHTKGIIHRDLKPTNVMVTLHDGQPVPRIIDFGVSKAMGQQLTEKTMFTEFAQMVGTPLYMSPEQAEMSGLDVDTRSDIYSLGVLLYELLTGATPFDRQRIQSAAFDELRRIIREEEPDKPSTRVSSVGESSVSVSALRATDPIKLKQLLQGELDWIVMKTLEKDRSRRYETASALVAEVDRYLNGEPVDACPPSTTYRLRKFARRYKSQVAVATGFVLLLVVSSIVAWALYADARIARNDAVAAKDNVTVERDRAIAAEQKAALNLQQASQERDRATAQQQRADQNSDELKQRLYDYHLTKAVAAEREGDLEEMQSLLADCLEDQRGWEWHRLQRLVPLTSELQLDRGVRWLAVNSVKSQLAVLCNDGSVQLLDDTTGQKLWEKPTGNPFVLDAAFSPDGSRLAVNHASQSFMIPWQKRIPDYHSGLELWDSVTGDIIWKKLNSDMFGMIKFSPNGQQLVTSSRRDGESPVVELRNAETGEVIWEEPVLGIPVSMVFSPDGKHLYLSLWSIIWEVAPSTLACWKVDDHQQLWSRERSVSSFIETMDKGTRLVTGGANHRLQIWDAVTGDKLDRLDSPYGGKVAVSISKSPDESRLVSRCIEGFTIWDWKTKHRLQTRQPANGRAKITHFCGDGRRVVSRGNDGTWGKIQFFDVIREENQALTLVGHEDEVRCLAFTPHGDLVSVGKDGTLRTWNPRTGQETSLTTVESDAESVTYSPQGEYFATGGTDGVKLWESSSDRLVHHWRDIGNVFWIAFDADGKRLVGGGRERMLKVWDVVEGSTLISHQTRDTIEGLEMSSDNSSVVVLGDSGTIELVSLVSGEAKELEVEPTSTGRARCLRRVPNSNIVAVGVHDSVEFWDLDRSIRTRAIQTIDTRSLIFDDNATRLFTGDSDGVVKVWNAESGAQLLSWNAHVGAIDSMVLSPDGGTLVTTGSDGLIKLWETQHRTPEIVEQRRVVGAATEVVNNLYHQSGVLRDVMAALTNDESLSKDVRRAAMEITSARGDRPRGPMRARRASTSAEQLTSDDLVRSIRQTQQLLVDLVEAESGMGVDEKQVHFPQIVGIDWSRLAEEWPDRFSHEEYQGLLTPLISTYPNAHHFIYLRGCASARRGKWREAERDLTTSLSRVPEKSANWHGQAHHLAPLYLFLGDVDRYRNLTEKVLADFRDTDDPMIAERTVNSCCLSADFSSDLNQVSTLIDMALTHEQHGSFHQISFTKGVAEYRRGEPQSALRYLEPMETGLFLDEQALAFCYKAMCLHHEQEPALAREALAVAERIINSENYPQPDDKEFSKNWHKWLTVQLAYQEAVELVR